MTQTIQKAVEKATEMDSNTNEEEGGKWVK